MNNPISKLVSDLLEMDPGKRMIKLCKLSAKEYNRTISPTEIIELETIQFIRKNNGEIDKVLKDWKENPDLDPRNLK
jgi:hypothetical protein